MNESERYQQYLCSPEWGRLRAAVMYRSGGVCERCKLGRSVQVHHLTYIRKYAELLEDLQAVCAECHKFIHGRSSCDPLAVYQSVLEKYRKRIEGLKSQLDATDELRHGEVGRAHV